MSLDKLAERFNARVSHLGIHVDHLFLLINILNFAGEMSWF